MFESKISKAIIFFAVFIWSIAAFALGEVAIFASFLALFLGVLKYKNIISKRFFITLFCLYFSGVFYAEIKVPKGDELEQFVDSKCEIIGIVDSTPKIVGCRVKFYFKVNDLISLEQKISGDLGRSAVTIYNAKNTKIGDVLKLSGKLRKPFYAQNIGQFDYSDYLVTKGVFTTFYARKHKKIGESSGLYHKFTRRFNNIRDKIMTSQGKYLKDKASILGGVIFGYRAVDISKDVKSNFTKSGLLHLLSASGLHVGLILGIWYFLMRIFRASFTFSIVSSGVVVLLYSCLTGFPPSILRAMLMAEFILLGKLIDRKADNIALLLLVCSILLLFNPLYIKNVGFQLSFIVTLGILFYLHLFLEKLKRLPDFVSGAIAVPIIAQLWALPLLIYHFNNLPLYSVLANIIVIPFMAVVSFFGFVLSVFTLVPYFEWACWLLAKILAPFLGALLFVSDYFSGLENSLIYVAKPVLISVFIFYILLFVFKFCVKKSFRNKKSNLAMSILFLSLFVFNFNYDFSKKIKFTFFSVGNADAIYVEMPNNKKVLVDTGKKGFRGYNSGKSILNEYFKDKGVRVLDSIILTHPDSDHIGGAVDVMKFANVNHLFMIDKVAKTKVFRRLDRYTNENNVSYSYARSNDELVLDKCVQFQFIVPDGNDEGSFNDDSIISYIKYKDFSALLMGDNEYPCFEQLKKYVKEPVDLIKIGHHGSKKCINKEMLEYFKPKIAVISVGRNSFGHPNSKILQLLKDSGVKVLRTDRDNMIEMNYDGAEINVQKFDEKTKTMTKIF